MTTETHCLFHCVGRFMSKRSGAHLHEQYPMFVTISVSKTERLKSVRCSLCSCHHGNVSLLPLPMISFLPSDKSCWKHDAWNRMDTDMMTAFSCPHDNIGMLRKTRMITSKRFYPVRNKSLHHMDHNDDCMIMSTYLDCLCNTNENGEYCFIGYWEIPEMLVKKTIYCHFLIIIFQAMIKLLIRLQ